MHHMVTMWLGGDGSQIGNIVNGTGGAANQGNAQRKTDY
jgi:hypothetical protein